MRLRHIILFLLMAVFVTPIRANSNGARLFDVAGVPMWTSVDPLAEKYYPL